MKLKPLSDARGFAFFCPGCEHSHVYYTTGNVTWEFNGNTQFPTFTPSLLNQCPEHPDVKQRQCHLFMTDGVISFCEDCSHSLAGKRIELPDWPW